MLNRTTPLQKHVSKRENIVYYLTEDSDIKDYLTNIHKLLKNKTLYLDVLRKEME